MTTTETLLETALQQSIALHRTLDALAKKYQINTMEFERVCRALAAAQQTSGSMNMLIREPRR